MTQRTVRADKSYRRKVLIFCGLLLLLVAALIAWILPWSTEYLLRQEPEIALRVARGVLVVMFLSFVPIGLCLFVLGRKIVKHERFPPPGVKVIKDTRLVEGEKAKVQGRVLVALGIILILFGLSGAVYFPYVHHKVTSPNVRLTIE